MKREGEESEENNNAQANLILTGFPGRVKGRRRLTLTGILGVRPTTHRATDINDDCANEAGAADRQTYSTLNRG